VWNPIPFLLTEASTSASRTDYVFFGLTAMTVIFSLIVALAVIFLAAKYRRGNKVDRSNPPQYALALETAWTVIPLMISMGIFGWASIVYFQNIRVPADAMDIHVVGKQWMWKIQHPEGRWEMDELHVPVGRDVKLTMTSEDVIHSFFVPAFRIKQDVLPGRYTTLWFKATKTGVFHLFCAEFCGTGHSGMVGTVTVMEPADYEKWLRTGNYQGSVAAAGQRLFIKSGCSGCHGQNSSVKAPLLEGIYGKPVPVQIPEGGKSLDQIPATTVIADDRYIHDSIYLPDQEVAAGFKPIMPTFQGRLSEEEVLQIIGYIRSLGTSNGGANGGTRAEDMAPLTPDEIRTRTGFVPGNMNYIHSASSKSPSGPVRYSTGPGRRESINSNVNNSNGNAYAPNGNSNLTDESIRSENRKRLP
jgi:cytochrome c oxidase subunit 2